MGFGALRALTLSLNQWAHGVDIVVSPPLTDDVIETRGIWLTDQTNEAPGGASFGRREPLKVLAIARDAVDTFKKGTKITAPPRDGDADQGWVIDTVLELRADHVRVIVIPDPEWQAD